MIKEQTDSKNSTDLQNLVTHDGVFAVDSEQRIVYWSEGAERITGYPPGDVNGRLCYEVLGGRDTRNNRLCRPNCPVMEKARRGRPSPNYDILSTDASGEEKWLNVSVAIPGKGRNGFQVLHLFRDVTRRRRIEEFARRAASAVRHLLDKDGVNLAEEVNLSLTPLPKLSRRESEVLRLLATGMSTAQIADTLSVQPVTARNHITRLLTKLGMKNRLQAVVYASRHRLI
ncbi:MAG: PAS and helix-turn-helix domain-containing protein [Chloroflexi bacterium]|nr:PAS and helix-turn-helix domain-containing protein [Chloroflexota bacterium]